MKTIDIKFTETYYNVEKYEVTDEEYNRIMDGEDLVTVLGEDWLYDETVDASKWNGEGINIELWH